jgi:hypothetical protein
LAKYAPIALRDDGPTIRVLYQVNGGDDVIPGVSRQPVDQGFFQFSLVGDLDALAQSDAVYRRPGSSHLPVIALSIEIAVAHVSPVKVQVFAIAYFDQAHGLGLPCVFLDA